MKYFGTDGIRGKYGEKLDSALAYKTGKALCQYFGKGDYVVGRDTRVSGTSLEKALVDGITEMGGNAVLLGILPTPAVAHLAVTTGARCGVMISASHNPPEYNGIKVFDCNGIKLTPEQENSIEYYIDNPPLYDGEKGKEENYVAARKKYIDFLTSTADADFSGLKVWLDCAYGASATVAKQVFESLGATVMVDNSSLRGEKINSGCGALHPDYVARSMEGTDCRLGFAFDGDADRLAVVMDGEVIDGDTVLYNISKSIPLKDNVVVGTVLNNLALEKALMKDGKKLLRTPVGDKHICDLMYRNGYNLGGEQSGHYIVYPAATTGDGILSAIFLTKALFRGGELHAPEKLSLVPQKAIAEYAEPAIMYDKWIQHMLEESEQKLAGNGRIIMRMSGTEPKVRVMVESEDSSLVDEILSSFKKYINSVAK